MSKQRLLVVGNGMVGHHFVEQLVNAGGLEQFDITVLGAEPDSAYDRVHLSEVFGGRAPKELQMAEGGVAGTEIVDGDGDAPIF